MRSNNSKINISAMSKKTTMLIYGRFFVAARKNSRHRPHFHTHTYIYQAR